MIQRGSSLGEIWETITPSDTEIINFKSLFCSVAGDLALADKYGKVEVFPVVASQVIPLNPTKVMATGTTATVIGIN